MYRPKNLSRIFIFSACVLTAVSYKLEAVSTGNGNSVRIIRDNVTGQIKKITDNKRTWLFEHHQDKSTKEHHSKVTMPNGKIIERRFDEQGYLLERKDNGDTVKKITWDSGKREKREQDKAGRITTYQYDELGRLTKRINPDNTSISRQYNTNNQITRAVNEKAQETLYEYTDFQLTRITEAPGTEQVRVTNITYDGHKNETSRTINDVLISKTEYDPITGLLTWQEDGQGNRTEYLYDTAGNVSEKRIKSKDSDPDQVWLYEHTGARRIKTITDPHGNITTNTYDDAGNLIKVESTGQPVREYTYNEMGDMLTETMGVDKKLIAEYEYDNEGRLLSIKSLFDKEGDRGIYKAVSYTYNIDGRLFEKIDGSGNKTQYFYTYQGNPMLIVYPTHKQRFEYDDMGRKTKEQSFTLDAQEILGTTEYEYDAVGNLLTVISSTGTTTRYEYDALNRLKKVEDAEGNITRYEYNVFDDLVALTDAEGNVTRFEYNTAGQVIKEIRPMGEETNYTYHEDGSLAAKTDAKGQITKYEYDLGARLAAARRFIGAVEISSDTFSYDVSGNLTGFSRATRHKPRVTASYVYDFQGRKTQETVNYGTFTLSYGYEYYKNGQKKSIIYPDGAKYEFTYNANNRLIMSQIPGKGIITYDYHWFRSSNILYPGGMRKIIDYDSVMRTAVITVKDPGHNVLMRYGYDYDQQSNITQKQTEHGNYQYGYDKTNQLTNVNYPALPDEEFTYDKVGNRLNQTYGSENMTYDHNANNELLSVTHSTQPTTQDISFEYDANGNLIKTIEGTREINYTYDSDNRLIRVTDSSGSLTADYYYDPYGRRLWKEVNGIRTYYFYADEGLIAEADESGKITKTYGYVPDSIWGTDPVWMKTGGEYHWFWTDHLATPQKLTTSNGAVTWSATYEAFGKATVNPASTVENNLRFPGQYFDEETGLHYSWMRYYNPTNARFDSSDQIGFAGGDDNLFVYVWSSPVNYFDPWGLMGLDAGAINTGISFPIYIPGPHDTGTPLPIHDPRPVDNITNPFPLPPKERDIPPPIGNNDNITWPAPYLPGHFKSDDGKTCPAPDKLPQPKDNKPKPENTPKTHPYEFDPIKGSKAKRNKKTGEIWEPDLLHKDHYEVYKNKRKWQKQGGDNRDRAVYKDGRLRKKFK